MNKIIGLSLVFVFSLFFLSWKLKKEDIQTTPSTDLISCYNMETPLAYKAEASQMDFANLHPSPKSISSEGQLGKMIKFASEDGNDGSAYLIPAKKKSNG